MAEDFDSLLKSIESAFPGSQFQVIAEAELAAIRQGALADNARSHLEHDENRENQSSVFRVPGHATIVSRGSHPITRLNSSSITAPLTFPPPLGPGYNPGMGERKRRGPITLFCESRRFRWAVIAAVVVLLYPISFGPACWVCSRISQSGVSWEITDFLYSPLLSTWWHNDQRIIGNVISWYANLWANDGLTVARQLDGSYCLIRLEHLPDPLPRG